jgi:hypothetical protein
MITNCLSNGDSRRAATRLKLLIDHERVIVDSVVNSTIMVNKYPISCKLES